MITHGILTDVQILEWLTRHIKASDIQQEKNNA